MNIRISETDSLIKSPSTAAVMKTPKVVRKSPVEEERSIIKETGRKIALGTTPAYTISISSGGRAALEAMKVMNENRINFNESIDDINNKDNDIAVYDEADETEALQEKEDVFEEQAVEESEDINEIVTDETDLEEREDDFADEEESLSVYEELLKEESEGISAEDELNKSNSNSFEAVPQVLKEAIAAYNFQMSYQINAAVMQ